MSCPDFSQIDFDTCDIKDMSKLAKSKLLTFAKKINPYQEAFLEIVLIVMIVHHLAIIYNAQRCIDLVAVTDACNAGARTDITKNAQNMIWIGRFGVLICTIMLVVSRLLTVSKGQTGHIIQAVFAVISLVLFIITLVYSTSISSTTTAATTATSNCGGATGVPTVTANPNQGARTELQAAANYVTGWSGVGLTASLMYGAWYIFRIVTGTGAEMIKMDQ